MHDQVCAFTLHSNDYFKKKTLSKQFVINELLYTQHSFEVKVKQIILPGITIVQWSISFNGCKKKP